jgi:hypothetical protein
LRRTCSHISLRAARTTSSGGGGEDVGFDSMQFSGDFTANG